MCWYQRLPGTLSCISCGNNGLVFAYPAFINDEYWLYLFLYSIFWISMPSRKRWHKNTARAQVYPHFQLILKVSVRKTHVREYKKVFPRKHILVLAEEVRPLTIPPSWDLHKEHIGLLLPPSPWKHSSSERTADGLEKTLFTQSSLNTVPASSQGMCWPPVGTWTGKLAQTEGNTCQLQWSLPLVVRRRQA